MSYTQDQLDALRAARASGVRQVQHDGKMVIYTSAREMDIAIARMEEALNGRPRRQIINIATESGWR